MSVLLNLFKVAPSPFFSVKCCCYIYACMCMFESKKGKYMDDKIERKKVCFLGGWVVDVYAFFTVSESCHRGRPG